MSYKKQWITFAALLSLGLTATQNALANDDGYYIGASAGTNIISKNDAAYNLGNNITATGYSSSAVSLDRKSSGYKFLLGYQFNRNFAVEAFYADLGTYNFNVTTSGPVASGSGNIKVNGYGVDAVGIKPIIDSLSAFIRFGLYRQETTADYTLTGASATSITPDVNANAKLGFGAEWEIAPAVGLRAEWEYYDSRNASVKMLSGGIVAHF